MPSVLLAFAVAGCPASPPNLSVPSPAPKKLKTKASLAPSPFEAVPSDNGPPTSVPETPLPNSSSSPTPLPQKGTTTSPLPEPTTALGTPSSLPTASPTPTPIGLERAFVATLAGGVKGFVDAIGADARFDNPNGLDIDGAGNVYVADATNNRIRQVKPDGLTVTLVGGDKGFANGVAPRARMDSPYGVAVGTDGTLYIADTGNHSIRKFTTFEGLSTLAGNGMPGFANGDGVAARFKSPFSLTFGPGGDLFVADAGNHAIRRVTTAGRVSTVVGGITGNSSGDFTAAKFAVPNDIAYDGKQWLYVADGINHNIRRIDLAFNVVTTVAGNGSPGFVDGRSINAKFNAPSGLTVAKDGTVLVADNQNHAIRLIRPDGQVSTLTGGNEGFVDGARDVARFASPTDLALSGDNHVIVADTKNHRIRNIELE